MACRELLAKPKIFDGTYAESRVFFASMQLYLMQINARNLSQRVIITLNHIRGERVDRWVASKMRWLGTVSNDPNLLQGQDIWSVFKEDFLKEFVYPAERAKARKEIENIKMEGIELDAYIHNFRALAHRAQYNLNALYTIHLFLQGLPPDLVRCCFNRDKLSTFDDWVSAARKYHLKYRLIVNILVAPPLSDGEALAMSQALGTTTTARDPSARQRAPLTEEDKTRYKREGKCFRCGQHGHILRMCGQKVETTSRPMVNETHRSYTSADITWLKLRALPMQGRRAWVEYIQDNPRVSWDRVSTSNSTEPARTGVIALING